MENSKHTIQSVERAFSRKRDINLINNLSLIEIKKGSTMIGNKTWGKIDFLCNYKGYKYIFVDKFSSKR